MAGHAADVVVANPNGIDCTGCCFINTPHTTLVTGAPLIDAGGALAGYRVSGGQLTVGGAGLDAQAVDRVDLIARAININAGVWARQLNVVTGANEVDAASLATQAITPTGTRPAVALDVSAVGGMYAGVIRLVGTEAGLGVNSRGQLAAESGDFVLTSAGDVVLSGKTSTVGTLTVHGTRTVNNAGTLAAGGGVGIDARDITNSSMLYSDAGIQLDATGQLHNSGQVQAQAGDLTLSAGNGIENAAGAALLSNRGLSLHAASLDNAGSIHALGGGWTATLTGAFANRQSGDIYAGDALALHAGSLTNAGTVEAVHDAVLGLTGALVQAGTLQSDQGSLALATNTFDNSGMISADADLQAQVAATASNSGTLVSGRAISVEAGRFDNAGSGQLQSGTDLTLNAQHIDNAGSVHAKGGATVEGVDLSNHATALLLADGALILHDTGGIDQRGCAPGRQRSAVDRAASLANAAGRRSTLAAAFNLDLGQALGNDGLMFGAHAIHIVRQCDNSGTLGSGGSLSLDSLGDIDSSGAIQAQQDLRLHGGGAWPIGGKL